MRRALPYRPRFNAPPRSTPPSVAVQRSAEPPTAAVPRGRAGTTEWLWWFLGAILLLTALSRAAEAQGERAPQRVDSALAVATADSAWSRLAQSYYDTTFHGNDWGAVRRQLREQASLARTMDDVRQAIGGMFARLGESHFALIPAEAVASWSDAPTEGKALGDVGLELRLLDGQIIVSRVASGSPADVAGVHAGWTVETLAGVDVAPFMRERLGTLAGSARRLAELQLPLSLMARLEGEVGSVVQLALSDGGRHVHTVRLARREITGEVVRFGHLPPQLVRFEMQRLNDARGCVGVVRFNVWMTPVMPRFDDAMVAFQRCRGVVLDLRGNVGGVAAMVMGLGGYFLDSAASLGTMTTRNGVLRYVSNPRHSDRFGRALSPYRGALAILVDGVSVSTSEIFAAAMQQLARGRVFGESSAGMALPAMLAKLPNGDVMQYVVADFTSPDGRRIEAKGVVPDTHTPLRRRALLDGLDESLLAALSWIDDQAVAVSASSVSTRASLSRP